MVASWLCCCLALVLLAAGLAVLSAAPGLAADREDGDLRLTGGGNKGRLQVYYNSRWGGVCDDGFGQEEADVACRQLGFPEADRYESRTHWSLSFPIWLDDVVCDGDEESLSDCSHTAWGGHNCSPQEHVWVQCTVATPTANPAVLVRPKSISMDEDSTATYKVWLGTEPSGNVTVAVGGTIAGVTVAPASLTFTTTDWDWDSRKTVTVSAADDLDTTDESVTLTHTPSGGGYDDAATDEVSITVRDDDIPGVAVDRQVVTIDEGDSTGDTYAVVLTDRPSASVTITVAGHGGTDVSVQPATLTFGTMDWITPQTVTVTADADSDKASDIVTLTHSASGGGYHALAIPAVDVRVQDKDIEVAASPAELTVEENGTASYALRTVGGPWDSLTVAVQPPADSGFTVSPSTVTFTLSDWDSPQTIRVTGQRDDDWSDDTWTIEHSAQGSGPGPVPEESVASVAVTVDDLGSPGALIDDGGIVTLEEGGSETYRIRLMRNPRGPATVSLSSSSSSKLSVSPSSLSFDSSNWSQSQTVTIEALQEDDDSADDTVRVRHRIAQDGLEASLRSTQVRITDDDDGTSLIGARPEAANVWWAALTPSSETGGVVGHIDYREPFPDTGKLSDDAFTYDGIGREIDAVYLDRTGHFQIWVDSGNGSALPNDLVLHVGSASMTLGSATQQSFGTTYTEGMTPMVREHTYWWQSGSHSVSLTSRQAVAVWLEEPDGTRSVPGTPQDVQGTPGDGKVKLKWEPPSGTGTKSVQQVLHYEYQQEGTEGWTSTDGPETTEEVPDLVNGESYTFRVRAVNAEGKGAASAPSAPVTPAEEQGLTGEFVSVPASHDGSSPFALQIEFSDEIAQRFRRKRNDVFEVTGGTVQDLRRVDRRRDLWNLTVAPSSDAAVEIVVPADRACDAAGAVCTAAGDRLSEAVEATVPGPPSTVSISAGTSPVAEGEAATFTLTRTGDTAAALTVAVSVSEDSTVLSGTPPTEAVFAAGAATAELSVATEDDGTAEADGRVTASISAGSDYGVEADAGAASVDVYDNDQETTAAAAQTLWSSTLEWTDMGGGWLIAYSQDFSSAGWSEDGHPYSIWYIAYDSSNGALWLQLTSEMPAGGIPEPAELTIQVGAATVGPGDAMAAFAAGSIGIASGVEQSWSAGESVAVHLTRAVEAEETAAGPGISVADAEVREAEGAVLAFPVTLDAAQASAVSVRYATSDGTAVAGADYETTSGALRFEAGETVKTVAVPVLNDTHNEGSETLTLVLSDPFGATLADGEATGTIVNTGAMPQAWITRFGRTVAQQAVDAIGDRLSGVAGAGGAHGTQATIGGVELVHAGAYAGVHDDEALGRPGSAHDLEGPGPAATGRGLTGRELLFGSSFRLGAGGEHGGPSWTTWGRIATGGFESEDGGLSLSGDVTTGFVGADLSLEHWLVGVALGLSEGEGSFDDGTGSGRAESSLTGVYPYARLEMGDGMDVWGLVGMGGGDLTLTVGEEVTETDLAMHMGALGLRSALTEADEPGAFDLALKTDALWVRTESDAARSSNGGNLAAASGAVSRLRVALEGSQTLAMGADATFTPTLELGLRHDGGDAETGTGVEAGLGLQYADPAQGLTVEARVRGLLAHTDDGYEEWGASGSIRLDPGLSGRGVSLSLTPNWGASSGGVDQLWATRPAAGLLADDGFGTQARLQAELGYGMRPPLGHGVLTPYAGFSLAGEGAGRTYHLGARWRGTSAFHVALEASHGEDSGTGEPLDAASLRASVRW